MTPSIAPYTPSLYQPDSFGRYRHYPRNVRTPIPGAGYRVGRLAWAEQELNLDGSSQPQPYGSYAVVPLRGLGQLVAAHLPTGVRATMTSAPALPQPSGSSSPPPSPSPPATTPDLTQEATAMIDQTAQAAQLLPPATPWLEQKVGPVPYWALGLGSLALIGGGATWYFMRRRHVRTNRRRR